MGDIIYYLDFQQPIVSSRTIQCGPKERYTLSDDIARSQSLLYHDKFNC